MVSLIAQGAEAVILGKNGNIIKDRIVKKYRIPELDFKLRKQRTKKEISLLEKAKKIIPVPKIIKSSDFRIEMELINGEKLSGALDNLKNASAVCRKIGQNIAKLHDANIIHGDLTTSNMIYVKLNNNSDKSKSKQNKQVKVTDNNGFKVYFIDFGLGFESLKVEDKAVDLHLIKQALEAKHFIHFKKFFQAINEGYSISPNAKEVLKRLETVEKRGRYKEQY